jgi:hypothetical protein
MVDMVLSGCANNYRLLSLFEVQDTGTCFLRLVYKRKMRTWRVGTLQYPSGLTSFIIW